VAALSRAAAYVRSQLGREITLRYTPEISFQADTSFDEAARIEEMLHTPRVARDLAAEDEGEREDGTDDGADGESEDDGQARQG
jgi:ribosome-binding factor A